MLASGSVREAADLTRSVLVSVFRAPVAVIFLCDGDGLEIESETKLTQPEIEAAKTAGITTEIVAAGVYPFDKSRFDFWPNTTRSGRTIVIGVAFDRERRPANPDATVAMVALMLCAAVDRDEG